MSRTYADRASTAELPMIDPKLKRALGHMIKGVQVVGTAHDGVVRAYCSHWVGQVAFQEPIVMASVSPKHDTYPLLAARGVFTVSILAGDQVDVGQYFSYPGRRFRYVADEFLDMVDGLPVVRDCIAWLRCDVFERKPMRDHELFFAEVTDYGYGRASPANGPASPASRSATSCSNASAPQATTSTPTSPTTRRSEMGQAAARSRSGVHRP
ncbi:MAG: flavin reductase [Actinobacteria bacterium]|nr:MAG: flavin reductase [Actinomycetota bacterium]